jgi:hypothetical protein
VALLTIDSIYQFAVDAALNHLQSGQISDSTFNSIISIVNLDLWRKYTGIPEDFESGKPISKIGWQNAVVISDTVGAIFLVPKFQIQQNTSGYFPYPPDYARFSSLEYDQVFNGFCDEPGTIAYIPFEQLTDAQLATRKISSIKPPSLDYPVFGWTNLGFDAYPKQIKTVNLNYLRLPATPFRNFIQLPNGLTEYVSLGSTQLEWPQTMYPNIAFRVVQIMGINIREEAVVAWMNSNVKEGTQ